MEALRIVLFSVAAAISYGIAHDMVTAHVCVEYFTIAHPLVVPTESPFLLAIGWGVIATWWVGLALGIVLALAARVGSGPKYSLQELRRSIGVLMAACFVLAMAAGLAGATLAATQVIPVPGGWAAFISPERHVAFSFAASAHFASYGCGALGGLILAMRTGWLRTRKAPIAS